MKIKRPEYITSRTVTKEINNLGLAVPEITQSNMDIFEVEYFVLGKITMVIKQIINWECPYIFVN